ARADLREALLRHRRPRASGPGAVGRGRSHRTALPVPDQAGGAPRRLLSEARRSRLGAGGAAEHGRLARDPTSARGGRCRPAAGLCGTTVASEPERGLSDLARARPGPDRARRSTARQPLLRAATAALPLHSGLGEPGAVLSRLRDDLPALLLGDAAP